MGSFTRVFILYILCYQVLSVDCTCIDHIVKCSSKLSPLLGKLTILKQLKSFLNSINLYGNFNIVCYSIFRTFGVV